MQIEYIHVSVFVSPIPRCSPPIWAYPLEECIDLLGINETEDKAFSATLIGLIHAAALRTIVEI